LNRKINLIIAKDIYLIAELNSIIIILTINISKFNIYSKKGASNISRKNILRKLVLQISLDIVFARQLNIIFK